MTSRTRGLASAFLYDADGIQVRRDRHRPTGRLLVLDGMEASYVDLVDPTHLEFSYLRRFRDVVEVLRPARRPLTVVHLGGGGGTFPRYLAATHRQVCSDVYEKDPRITEVAARHLRWHPSPRVRVHIGDARELLAGRPEASADVVIGDCFVAGLVPTHLSTVEFARDVERVLTDDGVYLVNIVDVPPLRRTRRLAATLLAVFPQLVVLGDRHVLGGRLPGNIVLVASHVVLPAQRLRARAAHDPEPAEVLDGGAAKWFATGAQVLADVSAHE